ncbi:MAG: type I glyceraldehyde-3-phosphate dehydrogenase [Myxococcota bacterium]
MRVAINGFGRIGRQFFRIAWDDPEVDIVHVNDIADPETLATLLELDSTYGRWSHEVRAREDGLEVQGRSVAVTAEKDPSKLPWHEREVDVVVESTGIFTTREKSRQHLDAGAKKVLITAPGKSELDGDFVIGVNEEHYDPHAHQIISIGSCTTNCLAPLVKVLHDQLGIERGLMTTVHAYTNDQNLLDGPHKDLRRARSAADNIVPTSTGAARAISKVLPDLQGKLDGMALRVPVPCGSVVDLTCTVMKETSAEAVNDMMRQAAEGRMKGVLAVADRPLVSRDIVGRTESSILAPQDTRVQGGVMVKVLSWYDNEWGFSNRLVDMVKRMS